MTFEEFKTNVEQWATERGIYEHSTPLAQALKACSEVGELCDAVIKGNLDAMADAVGDVAVCLVNVLHMKCAPLDLDYIFGETPAKIDLEIKRAVAGISFAVGNVSYSVAEGYDCEPLEEVLDASFYALRMTCIAAELDFLDCCEKAWNEIKDRKGRMVPGGAFVKDGEQ
jgi:NTP pyrophosphatase (non-canonical NTP hydrolase)